MARVFALALGRGSTVGLRAFALSALSAFSRFGVLDLRLFRVWLAHFRRREKFTP